MEEGSSSGHSESEIATGNPEDAALLARSALTPDEQNAIGALCQGVEALTTTLPAELPAEGPVYATERGEQTAEDVVASLNAMSYALRNAAGYLDATVRGSLQDPQASPTESFARYAGWLVDDVAQVAHALRLVAVGMGVLPWEHMVAPVRRQAIDIWQSLNTRWQDLFAAFPGHSPDLNEDFL